jgi:hypothetical protein
LNQTDDWRSVYRTLNYVKDHPISKECLWILLDDIKNSHLEKSFGKGVTELLAELEF